MHGSHLVKAYSRTQSNIALSSGEAEYDALVSTALQEPRVNFTFRYMESGLK